MRVSILKPWQPVRDGMCLDAVKNGKVIPFNDDLMSRPDCPAGRWIWKPWWRCSILKIYR